MRHKILIVAGTRPEVIKLAPVCLALQSLPAAFEPRLLVTGQHREMLDEALATFDLRPDHDLNVMQPDQDFFEVTTRILTLIRPVLDEFAPGCVIVQGDTTSTFISALSGYYRKLPVAHVEAGLRTGDKFGPYPEEANRRMVAILADLHFAPTETARHNLLAEGVPAQAIHVTGNTIIDALRWVLEHRSPTFAPRYGARLAEIARGDFALITCHRREIFGAPMARVLGGIGRLAHEFPTLGFVFPVHLNPGVQRVARGFLAEHPNVLLTDPLDYVNFAHLLRRCRFVLTDSGGVQEEAAALGRPTVVLREKTERMEGLSTGAAVLAGVDPDTIFAAGRRLICDTAFYDSMAVPTDVYGDGRAAARIVAQLAAYLERRPRV